MKKEASIDEKGNFENLYQKVINSVHNPIFLKDKNHTWILLNDAFCDFLGVEREALIGKSDYDYFPDSEADVFWEKDNMVLRTGTKNINEELLTNKTGQQFTILTSKVRIEDDRKEPYILGTITDITDMKSEEIELLRKNVQILAQKHEIENAVSELQLSTEQYLRLTGRLTDYLFSSGIMDDSKKLIEYIKGMETVQKLFSDSIGIKKVSLPGFLDQLFSSEEGFDRNTNILISGDPVMLTRKYMVPIGIILIELIKATISEELKNEVRIEISRENSNLSIQFKSTFPIFEDQKSTEEIRLVGWLDILTGEIGASYRLSSRNTTIDVHVENISFISRSKSEQGVVNK